MARRAVIFGASGLVGNALTELCAEQDQYAKVTRVVRRSVPAIQGVTDQLCQDLLAAPEVLFAVDVLFCCLGTTMKKAGSKEAFEYVDYAIPLALGEKLKAVSPAAHYVLVSAMGADPDSRVFYNQVKGRIEMDLSRLALGRLSIVRPSLLLGERSESRPMEALGIKLAPALNVLLRGPLAKYRAIRAADVARAMIVADLSRESGAFYASDQLQAMADSLA